MSEVTHKVRPSKKHHRSSKTAPRWSGPLAFAWLARLSLLGTAVVVPWLLGGVHATVQWGMYLATLVAIVAWLVAQGNGTSRMQLPLTALPLAGAVAFALFQLIPLSPDTLAMLSPNALEMRRELAPPEPLTSLFTSDQPDVAGVASKAPISLFPAQTRHTLAMLVLAGAAFLLASRLFRGGRSAMWLCGAMAANGAALAFFGLLQHVSWNGKLYWRIALTTGGVPFGPFVNRNNAGGYLNLCLAGAIGVLIWAVAEKSGLKRLPIGGPDHEQLAPARLWQRCLAFIAGLNVLKLTGIVVVACIISGVLCSLSRGAFLAMVGGGLLTIVAVLLVRRRPHSLGVAALGVVTGFALVGWVSMNNSVYDRLAARFFAHPLSADTRLPHWRDSLQVVPDFWQTGSGLGTYRYVYTSYQHRLADVWYFHAENQYLEALVEAGGIGLALLLAAVGLVAVANLWLLKYGEDTATYALAVAGTFALSSQVIHAAFDYGLYVPANLFLFALLCGAVTGRAAMLARSRWSRRLLVLPVLERRSLLVVATLLVAVVLGCREARRVAAAENAFRAAAAVADDPEQSIASIDAALAKLNAALASRPGDAEAHGRAAELWIERYRLDAREQLQLEYGDQVDERTLELLTSLGQLHRRAHDFAREDDLDSLRQLRAAPAVHANLIPAWFHLVTARDAGPTLPWTHLAMAELRFLVDDPAHDADDVDRGVRMTPGNADLLYRGGDIEWRAGRADRACAYWRRSLEFTTRHQTQILAAVTTQMPFADVVEKVLPESPDYLVRLIRTRYMSDDQAAERRLLAEKAATLIDGAGLPEDESYYLRGAIEAARERLPEAAASYERALELRPNEAQWRYELALLYQRLDMLDEAQSQASMCARIAPDRAEYRDLLEQIYKAKFSR